MADEAIDPPEAALERRRGALALWASRIAKTVVALALGLAVLAVALMAFLDTEPGHRLIVDRIAALAPHSGLRIRIGRIDGSVWGHVQLRDVRLYDPEGLFVESPAIDMRWRPIDYLWGRLQIRALDADIVRLHRLPKLVPSEQPGSILPRFDIHVGRLDIRQLRLDAPVTGQARTASVHGEAEIRRGRALVAIDSSLRGGGDRLRLRLDAEPDRDRFDLEAHVRAPAGGAIAGLFGTARPMRLDIGGEGSWARWTGSALADADGRRAADLALVMDHGRFSLTGWAALTPFTQGKVQRLAAPRVQVNASGTLADRRLSSRVSLRSAALRLETRGVVDLDAGRFDGFQIAAELTQPAALFPNMSGRQLRATAILNGPFGTADFIYRITAPHLAFDSTGFDDVRASGRGRLSKAPVTVPILVTARRVTGVGAVAGGILANLRVDGRLMVSPDRVTGDGLAFASDKLRGDIGLVLDLGTGGYAVAVNGGLQRYLVPGLGIVDVSANLRVVPAPGGRGALLSGHARASVRRLDNGFLASLAGGLPRLETDLARGPDGIIRFANLRLAAPKLTLAGHGMQRRDGTFLFEGSGRHADYGPVEMILDGRIDRPRLALRLARPLPAAGLTDVSLNLEPTATGFTWVAEGGSMLGPFRGNGAILLPAGGAATIQIAALNVSGTRVTGALAIQTGGVAGTLDLAGGGLTGRLVLNPTPAGQSIAADLTARDASFAGPPAILIRRGTARGVVILGQAGTSIEGQVSLRGVSRGTFGLARLDAQATLRAGRGRITGRLVGTRDQDFRLDLAAEVTPGRYAITGNGTIDGQPIAITSPAILTGTSDGWRLERGRIAFGGGSASLSGLFGARVALDARLQAMPLSVLDIVSADLGLGGAASGTVSYRSGGGGLPSGEMNLRVRGLTRSGLVLSSSPMDIGVNARLAGGNAALRAVMASQDRTVGRAQLRINGIGGGGDFVDQVSRAPMRAQIRYVGPADTLWRLTGIELLDLSGPVGLGADISGSIDRPVINGLVRARGARLESAVTGMVITNLDAAGRFSGSRLQLNRFQGTADEGSVSGSGSFDFAAPGGVGIDFTVRADNAQLLNRDDIRAAVTGDIRVRSDGDGGSISGSVRVNSGRFQLGAMSAAAQVPTLNVRERGPRDDEPVVVRRVAPWTLALDVVRPSRLTVTGLGMNSEWTAEMHVGGTVTSPAMRGEAHLVRGSYDFAGRRFDLTRGTIVFNGESPVNPQLDIAAEARIPGLNAQIHVGGTSEHPEITFTSIPAMPQDELLSRILFGTSITNLSAPEALQLASAVAALNDPRGGLDPINALRRGIGLDRLRILPADVTQGIGTQIAAGKYLGRRVYVELVTDGRGYSATSVEYQITRWLSLLGTVSTIGRQSVNVRVSRDY